MVSVYCVVVVSVVLKLVMWWLLFGQYLPIAMWLFWWDCSDCYSGKYLPNTVWFLWYSNWGCDDCYFGKYLPIAMWWFLWYSSLWSGDCYFGKYLPLGFLWYYVLVVSVVLLLVMWWLLFRYIFTDRDVVVSVVLMMVLYVFVISKGVIAVRTWWYLIRGVEIEL